MLNRIKLFFAPALANVFLKNIATLVGSSSVSQIIVLMATPILTRLYSPNDFGILALYSSILAIILIAGSLRYDIAIPIPEGDEDAIYLAALSLYILTIVSLLLGFLVFFLGDKIAVVFPSNSFEKIIWVLPFGVFALGIFQILTQWSIRNTRFVSIGATRIKQSIFQVAIQLLSSKLGGQGLVVGNFVGSLVGLVSLEKPPIKNLSLIKLKRTASRYNRFPKFSLPAGFIRVAGVELPVIVFGAFFSPGAAGLFLITQRVLHAPTSLIGQAVGQVFLSEAPKAYRNGQLTALVESLVYKLLQISVAPTLLLVLLGPELFAFIFGENWRSAGVFAVYLAPWVCLVFISSPLTHLTAILEKQKEGLYFNIVLFLLRASALGIGIYLNELTLTVFLIASVNALWRLTFLAWLYYLSGNSILELARKASVVFIQALIISIPVILTQFFDKNYWIASLVFSILLFAFFIIREIRIYNNLEPKT